MLCQRGEPLAQKKLPRKAARARKGGAGSRVRRRRRGSGGVNEVAETWLHPRPFGVAARARESAREREIGGGREERGA